MKYCINIACDFCKNDICRFEASQQFVCKTPLNESFVNTNAIMILFKRIWLLCEVFLRKL